MKVVRVIVASVVAVAVVSFSGTASAHAILESSSPASSASVAESPARIELRFNEEVEGRLASIRLFDESRREISIGAATRSPSDTSRVFAAGIPKLNDGVYVVIWRVTSGDGHPVAGAFAFQVGTGAPAIDAGTVNDVVGGLRAGSDLGLALGVAKFLAYLAVLVLIGSVVFSWRSPLSSHAATLGVQLASLCVLTFGSAGVFLLQGPYVSARSWSSVFDATLINDVLSTRVGAAVAVRLVLCLAWLGLVAAAARGASIRARWMTVAAALSVATLASFAVAGHASVQAWAPVFVALDLAHMAAVSAWAGALVVFAVFLRIDPVAIHSEARRFSALSGRTMPVAVVTGTILGLRIAGGPADVLSHSYGRVLLTKVCVVAVVVALGARARRHLGVGNPADVSPLRRTVRLESALVVIVLAVTSALVGTSPNPAPSAPSSFQAQLVQANVALNLEIVPARVGTAEVHALFTPPEGTLAPVKKVRVSLSLTSGDVPPIPVTMIELGPNHYSGVVRIPYPGTWRVEVRASPKDNSNLLFAASAAIDG